MSVETGTLPPGSCLWAPCWCRHQGLPGVQSDPSRRARMCSEGPSDRPLTTSADLAVSIYKIRDGNNLLWARDQLQNVWTELPGACELLVSSTSCTEAQCASHSNTCQPKCTVIPPSARPGSSLCRFLTISAPDVLINPLQCKRSQSSRDSTRPLSYIINSCLPVSKSVSLSKKKRQTVTVIKSNSCCPPCP